MAFRLSSMTFCFPQWLSAFINRFPIFLDSFPLSEKSEKIYLRRQVYKRSLFELRIYRHLLPELCNSRYNVYISPTCYSIEFVSRVKSAGDIDPSKQTEVLLYKPAWTHGCQQRDKCAGPRVPWAAGPEDGTGGARQDACTSLNGPSDDIGVSLHRWDPDTPGFPSGHSTAKPTQGLGSNTAVPAMDSERWYPGWDFPLDVCHRKLRARPTMCGIILLFDCLFSKPYRHYEGTAVNHHRWSPGLSRRLLGGGTYAKPSGPCPQDASPTRVGYTWDLTWWTYIWMGVLANHLDSSNHFVFSSRNFRRSLVYLLYCRNRWSSRWSSVSTIQRHMVVFCTYYSIEAQVAQLAISNSRSMLQEQKRKKDTTKARRYLKKSYLLPPTYENLMG